MIRYGAPDNPVQEWQDTLDVILTGAFNTIQASIDRLVEGGNGGSIVLVSSSAGLKGTGTDLPAAQAYTAAKRGLVGYMQRSEEHTSELQSLMRISYAVFCLKKKNTKDYN